MDRSPFRIVLINTASANEFNNTNSNFKNRLPTPVRLEGEWQVALDDIGLPGATTFAGKLNPYKRTLFQTRYLRRARNGSGNDRPYNLRFDHTDLERVTPTVKGVGFMKSVINKFEQDRNDRTVDGLYPRLSRTVDGEEQRTFWKWKWEGDEVVSDNASTYKGDALGRPWFLIDVTLAVRMGWLYRDENGGYHLGPNLKQELFDPKLVPELNGRPTGDVHDSSTQVNKYVFWTVNDFNWGLVGQNADNGYLRLSYHCNWRFVNLDAAFTEAVGSVKRTLLVYSDVCTPSTVGSQNVDLLREVVYEDNQEGNTYFEPQRLQHLDARNHTLDIIGIQIAEKNGDIANFHSGTTTVTLHFNPI